MFEKIISGGRAGADRAALDFAIKQKIPHGGWGPKVRLDGEGSLPKRYRLAESPTSNYQRRTEQNVLISDGTLIFSHGRLTEDDAYTRAMAKKHYRPVLHVDLNKHDALEASLEILNWVDEYGIKVLNVGGPRASKDPLIYKGVQDVLKSVLILESKRDRIFGLHLLRKAANREKIKMPETLDEAVNCLRSQMKLNALVTLAKIPEDELAKLNFKVGMWIRNNFEYPSNARLLGSCRKVSGDKNLQSSQMHMVIIRELWKELQETHKIRAVK
jgi:hypothetical protein